MQGRRQRSAFWIVSTHVLTTGFAMPGLAYAIGFAVLMMTQPNPMLGLFILLSLQILGYIGGVYYSLSYIRKVAAIEDPLRCVKPSIISFAALALVGLGANTVGLLRLGTLNPVVATVSLVVFYAIIFFVFARITASGFARMAEIQVAK